MKKSKIRRLGMWCSVVLCVAALIAGAGYGYWVSFEHLFFTVTENEVYRSGVMPIETLKNKTQKYKIKAVIDLRKINEKVKSEHAALAKVGVRHFSVPSKQVPAKETVKAFLDIMDFKKTGRCLSIAIMVREERFSSQPYTGLNMKVGQTIKQGARLG